MSYDEVTHTHTYTISPLIDYIEWVSELSFTFHIVCISNSCYRLYALPNNSCYCWHHLLSV